MATTTNYGWTTPDDTALVKDGAAAIRTLGSSIDTTTKNLNPETTLGDIAYGSSTANVKTRLPLGTAGQVLKVNSGATAPEWATDATGMTNPMTTTGDVIYSSSGTTPARLGIGTAGQILKVNSGATAPEWGAPPSAGANWTLLNSGGTALTGAATITVSGISDKDKLFVIVKSASSVNSNSDIYLRLNTDTGSNYYGYGMRMNGLAAYTTSLFIAEDYNDTGIRLAQMSSSASSTVSGYCILTGCNAAGVKMFNNTSGSTGSSGDQNNYFMGGYYNSSSTISSISIFSASGNFDNGTVYVYTSA
jgi:hypothetical protein